MATLFLSSYSIAQERSISGQVTSGEDNSPLPGVNIILKGTTIGSVTDIDGNFRLSVPSEGGTIVFSFIGFTTQEFDIGTRTLFNVSLQADIAQLSEVVVTGYGSQIRQELTGNIASLNQEDIEMQPVTSFEQAIQGKISGVLITSQNGKLGQVVEIRVRGSSSISATNQPLVVIDGVPVTTDDQSRISSGTNPLADINFNDIASIEVLKDASASAIYGSRGANGVILLTTKRGSASQTKFDVNLQFGFSKPSGERDWNNAAQYIELLGEAGFNNDQREWGGFAGLTVNDIGPSSGIESNPDYPGSWLESMVDFMDWMDGDYVGSALYSDIVPADTDWQEEAWQDAPFASFDLSASGGNEKTRFYISGSINDQKGILIQNQFERITGRLNLDHNISSKVDIGLNYSVARTENIRVSSDNSFSTPLQLIAQSPITPVKNNNGDFIDNNLFPGAIYYPATVEQAHASFVTTVYRNFLNTYVSWNILDNLNFRTEYGFDLLNQNEQRHQNSKTQGGSSVGGFASSRWVQIFNYTTKGYLTWSPILNDIHTFNIVAGMEFQESLRNQTNTEAQGFPVDQLKTLSSAATPITASSTLNEFAFVGYFGRVNYKLNNKYLATLSLRIDGSSRFGENNRYGTFPAASVGWIISEEDFLSGSSVLSFLKLRGSYGLTGNAGIPNYETFGTYSAVSYAGNSALAPQQIPNPDLSWEETSQLDIGIDFGLFNDKLTGGFDYYNKNTQDLLLDVPVPGTSGFRTQFQNVGELENVGIELVLNYTLAAGDFRWETGFNIARNENKILALAPGQTIIPSTSTRWLNSVVVGQPIGVHWGVDFEGADPDNGDALWSYTNSAGEKVITNDFNEANVLENRKALGSPTPEWIYGWSNTLRFKGIDFSFLFTGVNGNSVFLGGDTFMAANQRWEDNQTTDQNVRWQNQGDVTMVPQARYARNNGGQPSSRYVSDASFIRLKTASIGYTLPSGVLDKIAFSNVRIYVSGTNLFIITDYLGWDPEVNTDYRANNVNLGNDFYSAPQPRTITFGIRAGF